MSHIPTPPPAACRAASNRRTLPLLLLAGLVAFAVFAALLVLWQG